MDAVSLIAEIIRDLLIFAAAMFAMLIVLIVVVSRLPDTNPLKRILTALSYRIGATAAAGVVAIPVEPIPGVDVAYDIAVPLVILWYWYTFVRDLYRMAAARGGEAPRQSDPRISRR
jgi:hypothetical protein